MTPKIKKIIAREGLAIIGVIAAGLLIIFASSIFPPHPKPIEPILKETASAVADKWDGYRAKTASDLYENAPEMARAKSKSREVYRIRSGLHTIGFLLLILGYPFYLFIRYIIWAVRTLKRDEMPSKFKKIIAREGLVFAIVVIVYFLAFFMVGSSRPSSPVSIAGSALIMIEFFGYPTYILIRFITWAVRTLKEK